MKHLIYFLASFLFPISLLCRCDSLRWEGYVHEIIQVDSSNSSRIDSLCFMLTDFPVLNRLYLRKYPVGQKVLGFLKRNRCWSGEGLQLFDISFPFGKGDEEGDLKAMNIPCLSYAERLHLRKMNTVRKAKAAIDEINQHFVNGIPLSRSKAYYQRVIVNVILARDTLLYKELIGPLMNRRLVLNVNYEMGSQYSCEEVIFIKPGDCENPEVLELLSGSIFRKEFATRIVVDAMISVLGGCEYKILVYEREELPLSARDNPFNVVITRLTPSGLAIINDYFSTNFGDDQGILNPILEESTDYIIGR